MKNMETEADTRALRIEPVLKKAGWGIIAGSRVARELKICPGRLQPDGSRGKALFCDFVLQHKQQMLAVVEAKRSGMSHHEGIAQAKNYSQRLGTRFAFSTNGLQWYQIDMASGVEGDIELPFPSPESLWNRTFKDDNALRDRIGGVEFENAGGKWELRYYQHRAIAAALEAIANGDRRILLTLATGTGKTSVAFQIAWKLFHARWNIGNVPDRRPRILFLADRNILANQAYNAFSYFPSDTVARIEPANNLLMKRTPKNASIYFTLFQTMMTGEDHPSYSEYKKDFFDLVFVDECHRGGARDESRWRNILEHFSPAVQIGLTATPKRDNNADTYEYFGEPVYTYALHEGIADGFLTPFKLRKMASTIDEYVYNAQDKVISGEVEIGDAFEEKDFNTNIYIKQRELGRVREFLENTDQQQKTIVFCANQAHAAIVRNLINQTKLSTDPNYCHRVTSDDGELGEQHLRNFQDNDRSVPTILTTSHKLSTGVDARNIRHIVLMRPIKSMIEFKQIIGRGTRTYDGKGFFTIWDYVKAYENFNDPKWDGEPDEFIAPDEKCETRQGARSSGGTKENDDDPEPREKVEVQLSDGTIRSILYTSSIIILGKEGKPITATEYIKYLFVNLSGLIATEFELRSMWSKPESRERLLGQLSEYDYDPKALQEIRRMVDAPDSDLFDIIGYIRFGLKPKTRKQRVQNVQCSGMADYTGELEVFLSGLLRAYETEGESELAMCMLSQHLTVRYGSVREGYARLGGRIKVVAAFNQLQLALYTD